MKILAFETSCDDTSVALFEDEKLLVMETLSQIKIHEKTKGVVPEVAAREHANNIFIALKEVLEKEKIHLQAIDYIAVTNTPWLLPSLLTGITVASVISKTLNIPLIAVHHIEAHVFSNFLERKESEILFPLACLTVSWWHTDIYILSDMWTMKRVWTTLDDAAWEAYDKVAKMMGLGYPGWPIISDLAFSWKEKNIGKSKNIFPRVWLDKESFDFSFSWLKSSVKREIDKRVGEKGILTQEDQEEIAFEFQEAVNEVLAGKLILSAEKYETKSIMLAGWVSANDDLREKVIEKKGDNLEFLFPSKKIYSMDNAAMVGINAYYKIKYQKDNGKVWSLVI